MALQQTDQSLDLLNWMAVNLKIINTDAQLVPLRSNLAQLKVHNTLEMQRKEGLPIRAIICKARREGVSTFVSGRFFTKINAEANRYACVASADLDASNKIFSMIQLFQKQMPESARRETEYSSRKEIKYAEPHRSQFIVQTAGKGILGRGGLTHYFHISEFSIWPEAKTQFIGAVQEVPDKPDTEIIVESTSCGVGGAFYEMFWEAFESWKKTKNLNNYLPIFLPWHIFPDYQMRIPPYVRFEVGRPHTPDIEAAWCEEEPELVRKYKLCNEQLYWRRWAIKNKCLSDLSFFKQEFPISARESFQQSGRGVFSQTLLDKWQKSTFIARTCLFEPVGDTGDAREKDVFRSENCWEIWRMPKEGHEYALGVDVMEGKLSDPNDESESDYHGAVVFDRDTGEVVAIFHGRCDPDELGDQCVLAARFYNNAWAAPEVNSAGFVVLNCFKKAGYEKLYQRQIHDEHWTEQDAPQLGWRTTSLTRQWLVDSLRQFVRDGSLTVYSQKIIDEMRSFVLDKDGLARHLPGKHDDLLFGLMVALQLHLRCPLKPKPYDYATTLESSVVRGSSSGGADELRSLAVIGAKDPGVEAEEDSLGEYSLEE